MTAWLRLTSCPMAFARSTAATTTCFPGRENWGAADQSFPGIFTPNYMNDADGDRYDFNPLPNMETWYTNNDYANAGTASGSRPAPAAAR